MAVKNKINNDYRRIIIMIIIRTFYIYFFHNFKKQECNTENRCSRYKEMCFSFLYYYLIILKILKSQTKLIKIFIFLCE